MTLKTSFKITIYALLPMMLTLVGALFLIPHMTRYSVDQVEYEGSTSQQIRKFSGVGSRAVDFLEGVINSYRSSIKEEVNRKYWHLFPLAESNSLRSRLYISDCDQSILLYEQSQNDLLIVSITWLPLQMHLFDTCGFLMKDIRRQSKGVDISKTFESWPAAFSYYYRNSLIMYYANKITHRVPKFLMLGEQSIAIISNSAFVFKFDDQQICSTFISNGFLFPDNVLDWTQSRAEEVGKGKARFDIETAMAESQFFRLAMAHQKLSPIAREIELRIARAKDDLSFDYPSWEAWKDILALKDSAAIYGIEDTSFASDLLVAQAGHVRSGTLLLYYSNLLSFSLQWALINVVIFLCIVAALFWNERTTKPVSTGKIIGLVLSVITIINGWVLTRIPQGMHFGYWVLPGLIYVVVAVFLLRLTAVKRSESDQKE